VTSKLFLLIENIKPKGCSDKKPESATGCQPEILLSKEPNPEECDATEDDSSTTAGLIIKTSNNEVCHPFLLSPFTSPHFLIFAPQLLALWI